MGYWNTPLSATQQHAESVKRRRDVKYLCPKRIYYRSKRYNKVVIVEKGYPSDGATGAVDVDSRAWWVHDKLCDTGVFEDGTKCKNWQASMILGDILQEDGFYFRRFRWILPTFLFGGGKARENGMF